MYRIAVRSSTRDVGSTERRVSFRLLAAAADLTQGNRQQIGRIVAQHLDEPVDSVDDLLAELEPRLSCAIAYVELLPPGQRTTLRERFDADTWAQLDDATRAGIGALAAEMTDDWSLDGLTALVYAIPKVMLGLPRDAPPSAELKAAQRTFFKALYQLLCASDTGPRLPTLLLSIGADRSRELLAGDAG
jgi:lysyl-tRNA synthetase class 1